MRRYEIHITREVPDKAEAERVNAMVQEWLAQHPELDHNADYMVCEQLETE